MGVKKDIFSGVLITAATKYSGILIGLVNNAILARLLSPGEYGIVGVVVVFITFFNILSDIGLGSAIIQSQSLNDNDHSDLFKLSGLLSLTLAIAFALFSFAIASFYENEVYIRIGQLLAINVFFSSLSVVPKSLLIKGQSFKIIGLIEVSVSLIAGILAIFLAWKQYSYYAIIWRSIFTSLFSCSLYLIFAKLKLRGGMSLSGIRQIAKYSSYQFGFNFINYFSRNLDNILIGKFMGNASLGTYNQAYQLMMYPIANLTHVITPVLHPILAKFQDNKPYIFQEYSKVVRILSILGIPISIFIFFASEEIIYVLLGSKWTAVVPILRILSLSVWIQMILSSCGAIFQAAGRTDLLFLSGSLAAFITISAILAGIFFFKSMEWTAGLLVLAFLTNFFQGFYLLINKVLGEPLLEFLKLPLTQLPIAVVLITLLFAESRAMEMFNISFSLLFSLVIKSAICLLVFALFNRPLIMSILKKTNPLKASVKNS